MKNPDPNLENLYWKQKYEELLFRLTEEPTVTMESAGMDEARQLFGHGVTRTSIRRIFREMVSKRIENQDD